MLRRVADDGEEIERLLKARGRSKGFLWMGGRGTCTGEMSWADRVLDGKLFAKRRLCSGNVNPGLSEGQW